MTKFDCAPRVSFHGAGFICLVLWVPIDFACLMSLP